MNEFWAGLVVNHKKKKKFTPCIFAVFSLYLFVYIYALHLCQELSAFHCFPRLFPASLFWWRWRVCVAFVTFINGLERTCAAQHQNTHAQLWLQFVTVAHL